MSRADKIALLLSLFGVLAAYFVTLRVFEGIPHIEDEIAYTWQAKALARGHMTVPSPPEPQSFLVPFVVDYEGERFGKYPLGWPAVLAVGVALGIRAWINPLLAGLGVWLTYRLGKRVFGETAGLLAAGLTVTSPFFLMNSGSLLSHPLGLALSAAFALCWLAALTEPRAGQPWIPTLFAGLTLGIMALTRPLTAVGVGLPFGLHGVYLLLRSENSVRLRVLTVGAIAVLLGSLLFYWQYAVTGDPLLNPYTLWWEYDKIGFGPGVGVTESGHTLQKAFSNTRHSLRAGVHDLFGWGPYSWIFLPFGLLALLKNRRQPEFLGGLLTISVFFSLVGTYLFYWIGSWLFGPRYYYEGLYSLTLLSAAGISWLAGWATLPGELWQRYFGWKMARPLAMTAILALLISANLLYYTPMRLGGMHGLYGISDADLQPFRSQEAQELTPALIIVHPDRWMDYGALLDLQSPLMDSSFIFAWSGGPEEDLYVTLAFPERNVFHYYPDEPYVFYNGPRP